MWEGEKVCFGGTELKMVKNCPFIAKLGHPHICKCLYLYQSRSLSVLYTGWSKKECHHTMQLNDAGSVPLITNQLFHFWSDRLHIAHESSLVDLLSLFVGDMMISGMYVHSTLIFELNMRSPTSKCPGSHIYDFS